MPIKKIFIILIISASALAAQSANDTLKNIEGTFNSLEYQKTILSADSLLNSGNNFSTNLLINLYVIKGISHFSLLQDKQAESSFVEILKLDSAYTLDTIKTSPKIIAFYDSIKLGYLNSLMLPGNDTVHTDTVYISNHEAIASSVRETKNAMFRSIILPGWGHLYSGEQTKGIILLSAGTAALLSSIYFTVDTESKKDLYNNEKDISLISSRYEDYNHSYKLRNYSLAAYALIWLYTQIDLLLISDDSGMSEPPLSLNTSGTSGINISFRYNF